MRRLDYYTTLEDPNRADASEGNAHLMVPGNVPVVTLDRDTMAVLDEWMEPGHFNLQQTYINPTYILCLSDAAAGATMIAERFGPCVCEIVSPIGLLERLHDWAQHWSLGEHEVGFVDCFSVRYDKGQVGSQPTGGRWRIRLPYGQKPHEFSREMEYRCAVSLTGPTEGAPNYLDVYLGDLTSVAADLSRLSDAD